MPHSHKGACPLSLEPDNRTNAGLPRTGNTAIVRTRCSLVLGVTWITRAKSACLSQGRRELVEGQRLQLAPAPGGVASEAGREPGPEVRCAGLGGQLAVRSVDGVTWKR